MEHVHACVSVWDMQKCAVVSVCGRLKCRTRLEGKGPDLVVSSRGWALVDEAHALASHQFLIRNLPQDAAGADEVAPALFAAALGDGPEEVGFGRGGGVVDVVPVQAQARFQPQTVPRTQARHPDLREEAEDGLGWYR
jgi:hypothetical protein